MITLNTKKVLPDIVQTATEWFPEWGLIIVGSGTLTPEIIPLDAIWVSEEDVLTSDLKGTFIVRGDV